jgi:hypothetical protein
MAALLTLQEAKTHLRVTGDDNNDDIVAKMNEASDFVIKHANIATATTVGWANGTVAIPGTVKSATCLVLTYLYERGNGAVPSAEVWQAVERVMTATRVSALA